MKSKLLTAALWTLPLALVSLVLTPLVPDLVIVSIGLSCLGIGLVAAFLILGREIGPAAGLGAFLALLIALPAFAADGTMVSIPYGDWLAETSHIASVVLTPILLGLLAKMTGPAGLFLRTFLGERLIRNAVAYAVNAVEGASKGKTLPVSVGSKVLAEAVQYALTEGAPWLVKTLGGPEGIKNKIFRALDLEETATAAKLGVGG